MTEAVARVLRVSELNRYIKYLLEADERLAQLQVVGEVANLSRSPSGHYYFSLKDGASQLSCVLFRREAMRQQEEVQALRVGMAVRAGGALTVYEPKGTVQLYVERVTAQGEGEQARRVEALRARLEDEGLFAVERKRPLPPHPRTLALITSPGSQAYHDVLHRLRTQYPFVRVIEAGVSVQGEGAAEEIVFAIDIVNRLTDADVILLVRGGGAPEELAAFNDERLARAIFASRLPVVTGIGHEMDNSVADMVADVRAATPSLAAAAVVPDARALMSQVARLQAHAADLVRARVRGERRRFWDINRSLYQSSPENRLRARHQRADDLREGMARAMTLQMRVRRARLESAIARLGALDPMAILGRGYAVVTDSETGKIVMRAADVDAGRSVQVRVADGTFRARVEER